MTDLAVISEFTDFPVHPAAELFPLITGAEFDTLVADIKTHGLMEPIVVDRDGRLIDGRNRARACARLGVTPATRVYDGADVTQFVVSHNLHRRHLTDSQRATIAAHLATRKPGYRDDIAHHQSKSSYEDADLTLAEVGALFNVSESSIQKGKTVVRDGTPELQALVADGHAPVATAARVATELTPDEQNAYVEKVRAGADPVKSAPPALKQQGRDANRGEPKVDRPPSPPRYGGNRRKHLQILDAVVNSLDGTVIALGEIQKLDASVTAEEATRLKGDLSRQITALRRIHSLIQERTK